MNNRTSRLSPVAGISAHGATRRTRVKWLFALLAVAGHLDPAVGKLSIGTLVARAAPPAPAPSPGSVVLIGHDFEQVSTGAGGAPPPSDDAIGAILGNAVYRAVGAGNFRTIALVQVRGPSTTSISSTNVAAETCRRIAQRQPGCSCTNSLRNPCLRITDFDIGAPATAGTRLAKALKKQDVVVLQDLNDRALATALGSSAAWLDALRGFARGGGIVIALDGLNGTSASESFRMLGNPSQTAPEPLLAVTSALPVTHNGVVPPVVDRDCLPASDALSQDGSGPIESYFAPANTVGFDVIDSRAAAIFSTYIEGQPGDDCAHPPVRDGSVAVTGRCETRSVVLDRRYDWPTGRGPIRITAWERGQRRADGYAVIQDASGELLPSGDGVCAIRPDGTATYSDFVTGHMVTVTQEAAPVTQTATNVSAFDQLTFGRIDDETPIGTVTISSLPVFAGATSYTVTNGCETIRVGPAQTGLISLATRASCAQPGTGLIDLLIVARVDDSPVAYALATHLAPIGTTYEVDAESFGAWQTPSPAFVPGAPQLPRDRNLLLAVGSPGTVNLALPELASHDSDVPPFFTGDRPDIAGYQPIASFSGLFTDGRRPLSVAQAFEPQGSVSFALPATSYLPLLTQLVLQASPGRPTVKWTVSGPGLESADGGIAVLRYPGGRVCGAREWRIWFPPTSGAITFPRLPLSPSFDCARPGVEGLQLSVVGFCRLSDLDPAGLRRDFEGSCPSEFLVNPVNENAPHLVGEPLLGEVADFHSLARRFRAAPLATVSSAATYNFHAGSCGDNRILSAQGEECDGIDLDGRRCEDLLDPSGFAFSGGMLACTADCRYDRRNCSQCGNFFREPGESCDGFVGEDTCESLLGPGATGTLSCTDTCDFDTSQCVLP